MPPPKELSTAPKIAWSVYNSITAVLCKTAPPLPSSPRFAVALGLSILLMPQSEFSHL